MIRWWESLSPAWNLGIAFAVFCPLTFLVNWLLFSLSVPRSLIYGVIEGLGFAALVAIATHTERSRRA